MGISLLRVMQAVLTSFCVCSTEFGAGKWYSDISMQFYSESASLQEVVRQAGFERRSILCPIYNAWNLLIMMVVLKICMRSGIELIDLMMIFLSRNWSHINTQTVEYRRPEDSGDSPVICSLEQGSPWSKTDTSLEQRLRRL
jgi:hypothetical protein